MNKNLVQISNNCGVVSDENGNVKILNKENEDYCFQDILTTENELESLKSELNDTKQKLHLNKRNIKEGEIFNSLIIIIEIISYIVGVSIFPTLGLVGMMAMFYIVGKIYCLVGYGSRVGKYIQKKKLNKTLNDLEEKIPQVEKKLNTMIEKAKYTVSCTEDKDLNPEDYVLTTYHNSTLYPENNVNEKKTKIKVLSLTKKKNLHN